MAPQEEAIIEVSTTKVDPEVGMEKINIISNTNKIAKILITLLKCAHNLLMYISKISINKTLIIRDVLLLIIIQWWQARISINKNNKSRLANMINISKVQERVNQIINIKEKDKTIINNTIINKDIVNHKHQMIKDQIA